MKKLSCFALLIALSVPMNQIAFATTVQEETSVAVVQAMEAPLVQYGTITNEMDLEGKISIEVTGYGSQEDRIVLHLSKETFILDAMTGELADLNQRMGDAVAVYYGPMTTKSLPPQSSAVCILINIAADSGFPAFMEVTAVEMRQDGAAWATVNHQKQQVMIEDTVVAKDVTVGSYLLVWDHTMGDSSTVKIIGTAQPVVSSGVIFSTMAGVLAVNGVEMEAKAEAGTHLVPLRAVAEALGYQVDWNEKDACVVLEKPAMKVEVVIGSEQYTYNGVSQAMEKAAQIIDGVTYVPLTWLEQGLAVEVIINDNHV